MKDLEKLRSSTTMQSTDPQEQKDSKSIGMDETVPPTVLDAPSSASPAKAEGPKTCECGLMLWECIC